MKADRAKERKINCPSCGAPVTMELCPYCGVLTGISSAEANMDYPVLDCKEVIIDRYSIKFMLTMGAAFAAIGIAILVFFSGFFKEELVFVSFIACPFIIFGLGMAASTLIPFVRRIRLKMLGRKIQATVYGYLDDDVIIDGRPGQILKLLIKAPGGRRFILFQLKNSSRPYELHSTIDVMVYKDYYMICTEQPGSIAE